MDVAVSELRAHLSQWLQRAQAGDEVVVTDRGVPVARILGVRSAPVLDELTKAGLIASPTTPRRPRATGRSRPRSRHPVSDVVSDQRR